MFKKILSKISPTYKLLQNIDNKLNFIIEPLKKSMIDKKVIFPIYKDDIQFYFQDFIFSMVPNFVSNELGTGAYNFSNIDFKKGDICIDIGGNIGMTSIYLLKKYPFLKIYAFEPVKENYENFLKNLELNNINKDLIEVFNLGITKDGRNINMVTNTINPGTSTIDDLNFYSGADFVNTNIKTTTLDDIFKNYNIKKLKLLKIDCEGCEYEILYNTSIENLKRIENLRGELHDSNILSQKNYNHRNLVNYLSKYIKSIKVDITKNY